MKILIGGAWPYANESLHIGHLAALLPGDILARYHRLKGDDVYYVSGSDCYGTPVAIQARQENKTPDEVSDHYHREFCDCFNKLGFSYDHYGRTTDASHRAFVQAFHRRLYESAYVYEKEASQFYCETCGKVLTDRFVTGICPSCGIRTRGDQCDACGSIPETDTLIDPLCAACGGTPVRRTSKHLYIALSKLEDSLRTLIDRHPHWRKNATSFSYRYLGEGLRDRALTRDLDWGIEVPKAGYEDKRIYIWAENVLGYLSASKEACTARGTAYRELWGDNARHYYVHGKDNIPFHTLILPALLLAQGDGWRLPDEIVSSGHVTLEGRKISKSQHHAVWVKDIVDTLEPDSLRYFFIANGPEKRDADFTWREYIRVHNDELLGAWGNFVNRTLAFIFKYEGGIIPRGAPDAALSELVSGAFQNTGAQLEALRFRDALNGIFALVRYGNKYFDAAEPWRTRLSDLDKCQETLSNCVYLIANCAALLSPFLPFTSAKICQWLGINNNAWVPCPVGSDIAIPQPVPLFARLEPNTFS